MFANRAKVLLIVSQEVVDRARGLAGKTTITLKLPVSLQIVFRALIEEGLKRADDPLLLRNIERQAAAVRHIRIAARRGGRDRVSTGIAPREAGSNRTIGSGRAGRQDGRRNEGATRRGRVERRAASHRRGRDRRV
jgi:hypothetical protein